LEIHGWRKPAAASLALSQPTKGFPTTVAELSHENPASQQQPIVASRKSPAQSAHRSNQRQSLAGKSILAARQPQSSSIKVEVSHEA